MPAEWFYLFLFCFFWLTGTDGQFAQSASKLGFSILSGSSFVFSKLYIKWNNNITPTVIGYILFNVPTECWCSPAFQTRRRSSSLRKAPDEQWRWQQPAPPPFLTCPRCCYYSWPLRASGKFPYDEPEASALRWGDFHKAGHSASGWGLWWLTSTSSRVDAVATFPAAPRVKRAVDAGVLPPPLRSKR